MSESARQRLLQIGINGGNSRSKSAQMVLFKNVVKIQALFRAFMVRKRLEEIRKSLENGTDNGIFDDTISEE